MGFDTIKIKLVFDIFEGLFINKRYYDLLKSKIVMSSRVVEEYCRIV